MPIRVSVLRSAATRSRSTKIAKSLVEASAKSQATAFLCHSHTDEILVRGLQNFLADEGWDVYIDWKDSSLPSNPDRETAEKIKKQIRQRDWFIFLATANSVSSRWCPWEIGVADQSKDHRTILLVDTIDDNGNHNGNEYLQLYRHIDETSSGEFAAFMESTTKGGVLLKNLGR